jgi:hypothetical protein
VGTDEEQILAHEAVGEGEAQGPESLFDQLRAKRQEIAEAKETYLTIPGYEETGLRVKHGLLERVEIQVIARAVIKETKDRGERNMRILVDQIIRSTLGFYVQKGDEPPEPLEERESTTPVLNWDQFAQNMGWQSNGTARGALYFAFGNNEFAIGNYGIMLNRWMGNTTQEVDESFLGEGL